MIFSSLTCILLPPRMGIQWGYGNHKNWRFLPTLHLKAIYFLPFWYGRHKQMVWYEMLSYASCVLGQSHVRSMDGNNAVRRSAMEAFLYSVR